MYDEIKVIQNETNRLRYIVHENDEKPEEEKIGKKDELFVQLERYMNEQKPYTNPGLNRKMLADALNTNEKYLRDAIKNNVNATVNDYITFYRLKYANKLLLLPAEDYTIDAVAMDAGFNSRASFYEYYRATYGLTPNEFRKIVSK